MKAPRKDNPSSIFYWKDYENDEGLRVSSLAAQGLWMRLLCVAAKADPYGYVLVNGCEIGVTGAARIGSVAEAEAATLLDELERNGVFSRDRKRRIYCRRMVRDAATRAKNTKNGKKGGNPALSASVEKQKEKEYPVNPPDNHPLKPPYPIPHSQEEREEKKEKKERAARGVLDALCEVLPDDVAEQFIAHRQAKRSPLTEHAARLIAAKIRDHPDPPSVIEASIMNGWTGVFPDTTKNAGARNGKSDHDFGGDGYRGMADPAQTARRGQGASIASIAARRRADGKV